MIAATAVVAIVATLYGFAVRRFDRRFPARRFSRVAIGCEFVGLAAIWLALGLLDRAADASFAVHMLQHIVLVAVAAPALVLAAPVRVVLGALPQAPASRLARGLRSKFVRAITAPGVAWLGLPAVLWGTQFTPAFEAALEHPALHVAEHVAYLGAAVLFWSHVFPVAPLPERLSPGARVLYVMTAGPPNAFLGLTLWSAHRVMYPYYAHITNPFAGSALADQQAGGMIMWIGSGISTLAALLAILAVWAQRERPRNVRGPRRAATTAALLWSIAVLAIAHPANAAAPAAEGHALYITHCASCHGTDLKGGNDAPNIRGIGAAAVDWWVGTGRMPAAVPWVQAQRKPPLMDPAHVAAVVRYVTETAPGGPDIPAVVAGGDVARGRALFVENCEHCHGAYGTGATVGSRSAAPSLEYPTIVQIGEAIRVGPGLMPKFGPDQFSKQDLDDVTTYVVWLRDRRQSPGGIELGSGGPVGEGAVAWFVVGAGVTGYAFLVGSSIARKDEDRPPEPIDHPPT